MTSFQLSVTPSRRAAARFILTVRRALQKALAEEYTKRGITQSEVARVIGVHRSVINKELRGHKDITLGRVAELAFALGRRASFDLPLDKQANGTNIVSVTTELTNRPATAPSMNPIANAPNMKPVVTTATT